jgi:hypothetical protein
MAQIHKISGYLVDPNGEYTDYDLYVLMEDCVDAHFQQLHIETADIGGWDDNNPLNYRNCDLSECEKWFAKDPTKGMQARQVKAGEVYRHFKGHEVKVLAVAKDTENVSSYSVVYQHLGNGAIWYRPYDMFISEVDHDKYPEVTQKYRFEKVE